MPICLECGNAARVEFCAAACRTVWNNRRKARGVVLLDMYMGHRYQREKSSEAQLYSMIGRQVMHWRDEDLAQRDGRRSWRPMARVIKERPFLKAQRLGVTLGNGRMPT